MATHASPSAGPEGRGVIEQTLCEHIGNRNRYLAGEIDVRDATIAQLRDQLRDARHRVHVLQTEVARYKGARDLWRARARGKR